MSSGTLTPMQLRLLQVVCFALPVLAAVLLSVFARRNRKHVSFRIVDERGAPLPGLVSTVVGRGTRRKTRAIGRLDRDGIFRKTFTPFEPRTLLVTAPDLDEGVLLVDEVSLSDDRGSRAITFSVVGGALERRDELYDR